MTSICGSEYEALIAGAQVLAADAHGDKVLRLADGSILKLFRLKRAWSSARLWPYAYRFERNARLLEAKGFVTVEVLRTARFKALKRNLVIYRELPGRTLREVLDDEEVLTDDKALHLTQLAKLVAKLHHAGALFRSIHFGNVIVQPQGTLALIDVADLRWRWFGSLNLKQRARNFHHMLRYAEDEKALMGFGVSRFLAVYTEEAARLDGLDRAKLQTKIKAELSAMSRS